MANGLEALWDSRLGRSQGGVNGLEALLDSGLGRGSGKGWSLCGLFNFIGVARTAAQG